MIQRDDLKAAVGSGLISESQAAGLVSHPRARSRPKIQYSSAVCIIGLSKFIGLTRLDAHPICAL
jgi:hypothetical protein